MTGIFINILTLSVSMTPIIVTLLIFSPFFNKAYKAVWQYWLWLAVTLRLLSPFSFGEAGPIFLKLPVSEMLTGTNDGIKAGAHLGGSFTNVIEGQDVSLQLDFLEILALVYFAGAILFLVYRLIGYAFFRRSLKKWCKKPAGKVESLAANIGKGYGIDVKKQGIRILICKRIPGPMVIGFIKPVLLLPAEDYDDRKLKLILAHELVHIKRHDLLYKLLLLLVSSLHWFNPAVHFMAKKASQGLEVCCDAKVLQEADMDERKIYSHMIIELASKHLNYRIPTLFNTFGSGKENLETRINGIFSTRMKSRGFVPLTAVILVTLFWGSAVQISVPVEAYQGTDRSEPYRDVMLPVDTTADDLVNKGAEGNVGPASESPEKSEIAESLKGVIEQETNEPFGSAEVVIVDLNQLKQNQEQEDSIPQEL